MGRTKHVRQDWVEFRKSHQRLSLSVYLILPLVLLSMMLMATGCGQSSNVSNPTGGTGSSLSFSSGVIQGFGSVIQNDVTFSTDTAEVEKDGEVGTMADLQEGMVVEVEGSLDDNGTTGTADRVVFADNLEGPINAITETTPGLVKSVDVMGQTVIVENGATVFDNSDPITFDTLAVGQVVEVSGHNAAGEIHATFISKKADDLTAFLAAGNVLELKGVVAGLDSVALTFSINALTIDFSQMSATSDTPADGLSVQVKGTEMVGDVLTASSVETINDKLTGDLAVVRVEGLISNLDTGASTFTLAGQTVNYAAAVFKGGFEADLANYIKVEAHGELIGGVIQAHKVKFKAGVKIEANVAVVDPVAGTMELQGLPGIPIIADAMLTEFKDGGDLTGVVPGSNIKIRGRKSGPGNSILCTRFEEKSATPDSRLIIQGPVDSFDANAGILTILGITVDTSTVTDTNFKNEDVSIGSVEFFYQLGIQTAAGLLVKVRADIDPITDALTWDQVEIQQQD